MRDSSIKTPDNIRGSFICSHGGTPDSINSSLMLSLIAMMPSIYCKHQVPLCPGICCSACCLYQGGNPAVVMAGTVKSLDLSDAFLRVSSLQPVPFKLLLPAVLRYIAELQRCYSSSIYSSFSGHYQRLLQHLSAVPALASVAVLATATKLELLLSISDLQCLFMAHLQCCYCSSISGSAC